LHLSLIAMIFFVSSRAINWSIDSDKFLIVLPISIFVDSILDFFKNVSSCFTKFASRAAFCLLWFVSL
jgi:hypothetical protein